MALVVQQNAPPPAPPPPPPPPMYQAATSSPPISSTRARGLKGIGVTEIIFGVLSFICGAAASGVAGSINAGGIFLASAGCWCGAVLFVAGMVAVAGSNSPGNNLTSSVIVGVVAWLVCAASLGVSVATAYYSGTFFGILQQFRFEVTELIVTLALNGLVALFSLVGLFVTILQIRFSYQSAPQQTIVMTTVSGQQQQVPMYVAQNQQGGQVLVNYAAIPYTQQQPATGAPPNYQNMPEPVETKAEPSHQGVSAPPMTNTYS